MIHLSENTFKSNENLPAILGSVIQPSCPIGPSCHFNVIFATTHLMPEFALLIAVLLIRIKVPPDAGPVDGNKVIESEGETTETAIKLSEI